MDTTSVDRTNARTRPAIDRACHATVRAAAAVLLLAIGGPGAAVVTAAEGPTRLFLPIVGATPRVAPVTFGAPHGLYDRPFGLELQTDTLDAVIRYTADGSIPSQSDGLTYTGPIPIVRSTVIRAAAFRSGFRDAPVTTRSYILPDDVLGQTEDAAKERGFPTTWGKYSDDWVLAGSRVPAHYGLSPEVLVDHADALRAGLRGLPTFSLVTSVPDMFGPDGLYANPLVEGAERPASLEMLPTTSEAGFQVDCGVRIAGGYSRRPDVTPKHSFSVRFRSRYGAPRLRYPLFPDSEVNSFDVLRLRASQADAFNFFADKAQYAHDQWARDTQRAMGHLSARGRYVHLFVNGLYWGIYNVTEEPTAAFTSDHLGGDEEDWDVIKDGDAVDGHWQIEVEDGRIDDYQRMLDILAESPEPDANADADRRRYDRLAALLDLGQHAEYTLLQIYGANYDWPHKNWRAARERTDDGRFRFFVWDYEHTTALRDDPPRGFCLPRTDPVTGACGFNADTDGVSGLHGWLKRFPDYRILFADAVQRQLLDPSGALRPDLAARRYAAIADALEPAIVGESARWGTGMAEPMTEVVQSTVWRDYRARRGRVPQTPAMWRQERDRLMGWYFRERGPQVLEQLCRQGLYPPVAAPVVELVDGVGGGGGRVRIRAGDVGCPGPLLDGTVYYTRDGSDPRAPGGAVSDTARPYVGSFKAGPFVRLRARVLAHDASGARWSALAEAEFGAPRLGIAEVMYHPATEADAEFLELQNLEAATVDVSGYAVGRAVTYTLPAGTILEPGERLVLVRDEEVFAARYPGVAVAGVYDGRLDNAGETIVLRDARGMEIQRLSYDDGGFWPLAADGLGFSLVPLEGATDLRDPEAWRASARVGGSPGRADPVPSYGRARVVVHEVLALPGPGQEAAVEVANVGAEAVDLDGWFLSDDRRDPRRYRFPERTVLAPGDLLVVPGADLSATGVVLPPDGGALYVSSATLDGTLTGMQNGLEHEPAEPGMSSGRVMTTGGATVSLLERPTLGAPNAPPHIGPVVLNEVMYHPAGGRLEFVELRNTAAVTVPLHADGQPDRPWSLGEGIRFAFPDGVSLSPGGLAVVVPVPPDVARAQLGIPEHVPVFGPYAGSLDNAGEQVRLERPSRDAPAVVRVTVDRVRYAPDSPWPSAADGLGPSLERLPPVGYGSEPASWVALSAGGTPGRRNVEPRAAYLPMLLSAR